MAKDRVNGIQTSTSSAGINPMYGSIGVIVSFDNTSNTATVGITENDTDEIREILSKVPCPISLGVQTVSPTPGMLCWVQFRGGKITAPIVINYYNHLFDKFSYTKQYQTDFSLPSSLMD